MPIVTVMPADITFEAHPGETVMAAARRCGYRWPTLCEMRAECAICHMRVLSGAGAFAAADAAEEATLGMVIRRYRGAAPGTVRLACTAVARDDVTVFKRGVVPEP